jgi:hypothetical protein
MRRKIEFRRIAQCELYDAVEWYEKQREGLGIEFEAEIASCYVETFAG